MVVTAAAPVITHPTAYFCSPLPARAGGLAGGTVRQGERRYGTESYLCIITNRIIGTRRKR